MRIFVAIPTYDGKPPAGMVASLLDERVAAQVMGHDMVVNFLPSCSVPASGRNHLVKEFLDSGCDKMFFLDSDITWPTGHLIKLCMYPEEFVGGCYRFKRDEESYPVSWLPDPEGKGLWANERGLIEVETLPTGFLAISRSVFEKFHEHFPGRAYEHEGNSMFSYFEMRFVEGQGLHSDDTYFCKLWREIGGKVWLDPEITLTHWEFNPKPFEGHIGNWLKNRSK